MVRWGHVPQALIWGTQDKVFIAGQSRHTYYLVWKESVAPTDFVSKQKTKFCLNFKREDEITDVT